MHYVTEYSLPCYVKSKYKSIRDPTTQQTNEQRNQTVNRKIQMT